MSHEDTSAAIRRMAGRTPAQDTPSREVTRRDVQALVDNLRARGLQPSTIHNRLDPLRVLYRRALRDDVVRVDPMLKLCSRQRAVAVYSRRRPSLTRAGATSDGSTARGR